MIFFELYNYHHVESYLNNQQILQKNCHFENIYIPYHKLKIIIGLQQMFLYVIIGHK